MNRYRYKLNMKAILFYLALLFAVMFMLLIFGCGTRKTANDLNKTKTEIKEGAETNQKSGSSAVREEVKESTDTHESNNDVTTTENTKKYDANGKLIEEVSKTIIDKSRNKSTSHKKSNRRSKKDVWLNIRSTTYHLQILTTKQKRKSVEADKTVATNFGGSWFLILAVVIVTGATFLYFYLKKR